MTEQTQSPAQSASTPEPNAGKMLISVDGANLLRWLIMAVGTLIGGGLGSVAANRGIPDEVRQSIQEGTRATQLATAALESNAKRADDLMKQLSGLQLTLTEVKGTVGGTTKDLSRVETRMDTLESRVRSLETRQNR